MELFARIRAARVAVCLAVLLSFAVAGEASAATKTVCASGCDATTIQGGINAASNGDTVEVDSGTYVEDVNVNKPLVLQGEGAGSSIISGPSGGDGATVRAAAADVVIDGFTITRQGNNTTDWNDPNLNSVGVAVQGLTVDVEVRNSLLTGNRTGVDINNANGSSVHNNVIDNNRTGLILRNQTDNVLVTENTITNNWTVGIVFLDASGGTNSPVQTAANSTFEGNNISGNWYGGIAERQTGGSLPTPGTTNLKDFSGNWFGNTAPVVTTANTTEPGYAAQIP
jgi:parallel beta-helix repeat protein